MGSKEEGKNKYFFPAAHVETMGPGGSVLLCFGQDVLKTKKGDYTNMLNTLVRTCSTSHRKKIEQEQNCFTS